MYDFQSEMFRAAMVWPVSVSLVLFGIGMLFGLQGFRFARFLLAAVCGCIGLVGGSLGAELAGLPPAATAMAVAIAVAMIAMAHYRFSLTLASVATFAALSHYVAVRIGFQPDLALYGGGIGAALGLMMPYLCFRSLPLVLTTIQGAAMMIIGFVGVAATVAPAMADTFVSTARTVSPMVPVLLTMLSVLGYSVQVNHKQGDIQTGGAWSASEP